MNKDRQLQFSLVHSTCLYNNEPSRMDRAILVLTISMGLERSKFKASIRRECDIYELNKDYGILN